MKILHLINSDYKGGASRAALRIHESLLKKKINSYVKISITNNYKIKNKNIIKPKLFENYLNKIKSVTETIISKILSRDSFVKNSISLFPTQHNKYINESNYDIVHLHWINGETISIEDIGKITKPIVWTIQDMWPFSGSAHYTLKERYKDRNFNTKFKISNNLLNFDIEKFVWKRKIKSWKKNINIVGASKWLTNCGSKSFLMKKFSKTTINNTLDTSYWRPQNKNECKKYFNIPENIRLIGFSSLGKNNSLLKGKDLFLSAVQQIVFHKDKLGIFSIGDKNDFFRLSDNFKFYSIKRLDNDDMIRKFYNSLDLIVVPSRLEGFGQIASEAISCGVPVVAFNTTGLKDIVIHKKNGWLAKPYKVKQLAEGIDYILSLKPRFYKEMSSYGINLAKQKFSYEIISDKYIKLYQKILS